MRPDRSGSCALISPAEPAFDTFPQTLASPVERFAHAFRLATDLLADFAQAETARVA